MFQKKIHKVKILIWSDLSLSNIERLNEIQDYDRIRRLLADIFSLGNYKQNLKSNIVLDLFYYTLQFARKQHFSPEQTSAFFSIIKRVLEVCQETPFGNLDYTYQHFKDLLFCHCVNRPPMSVEIFTKEQAISICTYTLNTFFRHFKLYKYVFTPTIRLDLSLKYVGTSPVSPAEAEVKETDDDDEEEDTTADEEIEQEEADFEKLQAQEQLKLIVTDFLLREAKKIEGSVDNHLKAAIDSLNAKIDPLLETAPVKNVKGKKK
ncbi:unnamed protein product [Candidula unifasciata]|uniref:Coiled-coil domain-containing protein 189 n=1 Tax=Candidula unifasciata TaxID=100452 RepID=A0A8S3YG40_9EUPU|nr:unnamed protein product [Candidula unifasciata]